MKKLFSVFLAALLLFTAVPAFAAFAGEGEPHTHTDGEPAIENNVPATCTEPGSYDLVVRCTECGVVIKSQTITVQALNHGSKGYTETTVPATCVQEGYTEVRCVACGELTDRKSLSIDPDAHDWGEWETVRPATVNEEGLMRRVCKNDASHVEEKTLPRLTSTEEPVVTGGSQNFFSRIVEFMRGIIDFILRLFHKP